MVISRWLPWVMSRVVTWVISRWLPWVMSRVVTLVYNMVGNLGDM